MPDFDILTGGFPCQAFSMMGHQKGFGEERGKMFFEIMKIVNIKKPKFLLLENVKNLLNHDKGNTYKVIKSALEKAEYKVYENVFNTKSFGLAQIRNRVLIFACKRDYELDVNFDENSVKSHFETIQKNKGLLNQENVFDVLKKDAPQNFYLTERIKPTILSDGTGGYSASSDINKIIARPLTASMCKMHRACQDNYYSSKFIETEGVVNDALNLPKEDICRLKIRKLMPEEAFMLQGFPEEFCKRAQNVKVSNGALYKQAGNAVSVNTIYAVLRFIFDHIKHYDYDTI